MFTLCNNKCTHLYLQRHNGGSTRLQINRKKVNMQFKITVMHNKTVVQYIQTSFPVYFILYCIVLYCEVFHCDLQLMLFGPCIMPGLVYIHIITCEYHQRAGIRVQYTINVHLAIKNCGLLIMFNKENILHTAVFRSLRLLQAHTHKSMQIPEKHKNTKLES